MPKPPRLLQLALAPLIGLAAAPGLRGADHDLGVTDADLGMAFVGILYHDDQGFMVRRAGNALSVMDLSRKRICAVEDTTSPGNAEVFDRNLGNQSQLKVKRGLNALWRDGGILYAPPAR